MIYNKEQENSSDDDLSNIPQKIILNEITEEKTVYSYAAKNEKKLQTSDTSSMIWEKR